MVWAASEGTIGFTSAGAFPAGADPAGSTRLDKHAPLHIPLHPTAAHRAPGMFYWDINPGLHPSKTQLIYPFVASGDRMPDTHQSSLQGACKAKPGAAFHLWRYSQHILRQGEPWSGAGHNLLILRWAEEAGMAGQREG